MSASIIILTLWDRAHTARTHTQERHGSCDRLLLHPACPVSANSLPGQATLRRLNYGAYCCGAVPPWVLTPGPPPPSDPPPAGFGLSHPARQPRTVTTIIICARFRTGFLPSSYSGLQGGITAVPRHGCAPEQGSAWQATPHKPFHAYARSSDDGTGRKDIPSGATRVSGLP